MSIDCVVCGKVREGSLRWGFVLYKFLWCEKEIFRIIIMKEYYSCSCIKVSKKWYYVILFVVSLW